MTQSLRTGEPERQPYPLTTRSGTDSARHDTRYRCQKGKGEGEGRVLEDWAALPVIARGLNGLGCPQHHEFLPWAANDLEADWQASFGESRR